MFLPHPRVKVSIVGSLRDREVACSALDSQGSNFESCVWRTVSSQSSHHPQEVLLAQFSLYVHKVAKSPIHFISPAHALRLWLVTRYWSRIPWSGRLDVCLVVLHLTSQTQTFTHCGVMLGQRRRRWTSIDPTCVDGSCLL